MLNIGNPNIARKVLEKANTAGTTSVDVMFLVIFISPLAFLSREDLKERSKLLLHERITAPQAISKPKSCL